MKKIICAVLALTLLGGTAAEAHGWHGGWHGGRGGDWALGLGLGFLALGAVAAASDHDRYYRDRDEEYYRERGYYDRGRYDQDRYDHRGYRDRDDRDDDDDYGDR